VNPVDVVLLAAGSLLALLDTLCFVGVEEEK
jgi:hypothetical protein